MTEKTAPVFEVSVLPLQSDGRGPLQVTISRGEERLAFNVDGLFGLHDWSGGVLQGAHLPTPRQVAEALSRFLNGGPQPR